MAILTDGTHSAEVNYYMAGASKTLAYLNILKLALNCVRGQLRVPCHIYTTDSIGLTSDTATQDAKEKYGQLLDEIGKMLGQFSTHDVNVEVDADISKRLGNMISQTLIHKSYRFLDSAI